MAGGKKSPIVERGDMEEPFCSREMVLLAHFLLINVVLHIAPPIVL